MAKLSKMPKEQACCDVVEGKRHRRKQGDTPQPWLVRKFMVGFASAIIIYAAYVYVGRLSVPMVLRQHNALGSRAMGIAFLSIFSVLLLMSIWTYVKVICTSPGYAIDTMPHHPESASCSIELEGPEYRQGPPVSSAEKASVPNFSTPPDRTQGPTFGASAALAQEIQPRMSGTTDVESAVMVSASIYSPSAAQFSVLSSAQRFCSRDGIIRPVRAHHCRQCGTCVLKYDHHCPWVGQCVGARNHKFFVNFLQWISLYCVWIFGSTLGPFIKGTTKAGIESDPQIIVIIIVAGFFGVFTVAMLLTHVWLISRNQTTVESLEARDVKNREDNILDRMYPWYKFRARKITKRARRSEWGDVDKEGNLWWLGSARANWESVMGKNVFSWFLPIGRSESDGLSYPTNPRFDKDGRLMPRKEWPAGLQ